MGKVLAGESSAEEVNTKGAWVIPPSWLLSAGPTIICLISRRWLETKSEGTEVGVTGDSWPMSGEDRSASLVRLALPDDPHACSLEAEIESSDAGTDRSDS